MALPDFTTATRDEEVFSEDNRLSSLAEIDPSSSPFAEPMEIASPSQRSLVYSLVARGTTVLAEHPSALTATTNAPQVASLILNQIKPEESIEHLAYYITTAATANIADGITYICITSDVGGHHVPSLFLNSIQKAFTEEYSDHDIASVPPYGLNSFAKTLNTQMEWANGGLKGSGGDNGEEWPQETNQTDIESLRTENHELRELFTEYVEKDAIQTTYTQLGDFVLQQLSDYKVLLLDRDSSGRNHYKWTD